MKTTNDPLAYASETPDVSALIEEFQNAQLAGACSINNIARAENVRYNRRPGKSNPPDGCLWQENAPDGTKVVRPYSGRPDTDVLITDEICEAEVDMDLTARAMARAGASTTHTSHLTSRQSAELVAMTRHVQNVIEEDLVDDEELAAQIKAEAGWSVVRTSWLRKSTLVERTLDLEDFAVKVAQIAGARAGQILWTAILDPTFEDLAISAVQQLFGYLPKARCREIVRDLRTTGQAVFLDRQQTENRPTVNVLIPGYNYFVLGATRNLQKARGHLIIERFSQAELEAVAKDENWNEEFVEAVIGTAGDFSSEAELMRRKSTSEMQESEDRSIELWTTKVYQFDEETGAAGWYCTTFSPHLQPGASGTSHRGLGAASPKAFYAKHYLLADAHGQAPFVQLRRDVTGPALNDARGVADITGPTQMVVKKLQDAGVTRAHLEVDPPLQLSGPGWSKADEPRAPGSTLRSLVMGDTAQYLETPKGSPQVVESSIVRLLNGVYRQFALPDPEVHPARWQPRQMRKAKRSLAPWRQIYWQLVVLCYQEYDDAELTAIIGHPPTLTVNDLLRHRVTLTFDARALDADYRKDIVQLILQLLTMDQGGAIDTGKAIQLVGNLWDPVLIESIVRDPEGAQAALYRKVEQDMMSLMDGNPPQLSEDDATAKRQLEMAFSIIGQNREYQKELLTNPQKMETFKTWVNNRKHNVQETQLSPMQGRLGVAAMPQRPVQSGRGADY